MFTQYPIEGGGGLTALQLSLQIPMPKGEQGLPLGDAIASLHQDLIHHAAHRQTKTGALARLDGSGSSVDHAADEITAAGLHQPNGHR